MANGNVVVADGTTSNNFPTTASSIQKNVEGLALVPGGDIVFSGSTESVLPITTNAVQKTRTNRDAMFGSFSPDLQTVRYLSYFGGGLNEEFRALAVTPSGDIAVAGQTQSSDFPCKAAFDTTIEPGSYQPDEAVIYTVLSPTPSACPTTATAAPIPPASAPALACVSLGLGVYMLRRRRALAGI